MARYSIKTLWAIAKSPELNLSDEDLYAFVGAETGKDSIRKLTQGQIDKVCRLLQARRDKGKKQNQKARIDEGGQEGTEALRRKIFVLTEQLGWSDNPKRLSGMCKKMFSVDTVQWLTRFQCVKLIEALKEMKERAEAVSQ